MQVDGSQLLETDTVITLCKHILSHVLRTANKSRITPKEAIVTMGSVPTPSCLGKWQTPLLYCTYGAVQ